MTGNGSSRAVRFGDYGPADVLRVDTVRSPVAGPGEIRVRVRTAGLNPFDSKVRSGVGHYRSDGPFPRGVGQDFAGVVDTVDGAPTYHDGIEIAVGDEVIGWADRRSMSDQLVVAPTEVIRKPAELSWEVAGAIGTPARTARTSLDLLAIDGDDVLLVGGAAGGVGSLLTQLARARGARVIGTAGAANAEFLRSIGAVPVEYGNGLLERVRGTGLAVTTAVDCHGREVVDTALALGLAPGAIQTIVRHDVTAALGLADPGFPQRDARGLQEVVDTVIADRIDVPIRAYPVAEVVAAYAELDAGHVRGKLVVRMS